MFIFVLYPSVGDVQCDGKKPFYQQRSCVVSGGCRVKHKSSDIQTKKTGTKYLAHVVLILSFSKDNPRWPNNRAVISLELSLLKTPPLDTLFSQIPNVLISYSSTLRASSGGHRPNVFYYVLLIQAPTERQFKHLMFSTAAHTARGDTSPRLCVFFIWMRYSWHTDSWEEVQEGTTTCWRWQKSVVPLAQLSSSQSL